MAKNWSAAAAGLFNFRSWAMFPSLSCFVGSNFDRRKEKVPKMVDVSSKRNKKEIKIKARDWKTAAVVDRRRVNFQRKQPSIFNSAKLFFFFKVEFFTFFFFPRLLCNVMGKRKLMF